MDYNYNEEALEYFYGFINMINEDFKAMNIYDMEYLLINHSIEDVLNVIASASNTYKEFKDAEFEKGGTFEDILLFYLTTVKNRYEDLLIKDGKSDKTADKYYDNLKSPTRNSNGYIHEPKKDIGMIQSEVQKKLLLMRDAILAYYKVYQNKQLIAVLSTNKADKDEYIEFEIKEKQLLHLLGVTANQLRTNPDFIRLTGKPYMKSEEILEWIVRDVEGNNDLLQFNEDFIKRIKSNNIELAQRQFDKETQTSILNYHKVGAKSQTFLKYGPYEKVNLVAKLAPGKRLTVNANSNIVMASFAETFKKYPWAFFGMKKTPNEQYIETLLIETPDNKKEIMKGSQAGVIKEIREGGKKL